MNIHIVLLILCVPCVLTNHWPLEINSFQDFFEDQSETMKAFLQDQKGKVENAINSSYEEAVKMKNSVSSFVEGHQRKFSDDISNYVESVKESGRNAVNSWSYIPSEEPGARMEKPEVVLSVPSMIAQAGYTCETHTVISEGYLLNIHRIPRSKNGAEISSKTVLLQHGIFASSADWIMNGPEKGLAYVLADAGYDVWMSNIRGNKYSREHAWLKTESKSYWNFSWHDVALHDVPAIIDHIIKIKGRDAKISYIGHSMGTTIFFAMLTLRPEYNNVLSSGIALAPEVFMTNIKSPLKSMAPVTSNVAYMEMLYGSHEFVPKNSALGKIFSSSCITENLDSTVCKNVLFYLCGYDEKQFNQTILPVFLANFGTGTSWKTAVHFAQSVISGGKFRQFDYGTYHNQQVYAANTPPEYDLSKITLPITLVWSQNDLLSSEEDVRLLHSKLPATTEMFMVPFPEFNHLDYLWAVDADTLLNPKILETLNSTLKSKMQNKIFPSIFGLNK